MLPAVGAVAAGTETVGDGTMFFVLHYISSHWTKIFSFTHMLSTKQHNFVNCTFII